MLVAVLGLIPARGGSKGLARKNLRRVGGRTLLARAVAALRESGVVDHVLVSTDDVEMAEEALQAGAEVPFLRPAELASDEAPMIPVIEHALAEFERRTGVDVDTLVFTEATLPFRSARHVAEAMTRYREADCRSVITVCPLERKPHNIFVKTASRHLERYIREPTDTFTRRQDMTHLCRLSSGVYVVNRAAFAQERALIVEPVGYTQMELIESVNIDSEIDLLVAEAIADRHAL